MSTNLNTTNIEQTINNEENPFIPSKCHARLMNKLSTQCKNNKKQGDYCNIHYKKYLKCEIISIYDIYPLIFFSIQW